MPLRGSDFVPDNLERWLFKLHDADASDKTQLKKIMRATTRAMFEKYRGTVKDTIEILEKWTNDIERLEKSVEVLNSLQEKQPYHKDIIERLQNEINTLKIEKSNCDVMKTILCAIDKFIMLHDGV